MFACLYSLSTPVAALVSLAESFTPRFEVVGPLVMLDASGLTRLFGTPREIGEQLRAAARHPVRIAIAPTQTTAALLALGRPGLTVLNSGEQVTALADLPVGVLGEFERLRIGSGPMPAGAAKPARATASASSSPGEAASTARPRPPQVGPMVDVLPYFQSSLDRISSAATVPYRVDVSTAATPMAVAVSTPVSAPAPRGGGWQHPRDAHAAAHARRRRTMAADTASIHALAPGYQPRAGAGTSDSARGGTEVEPVPDGRATPAARVAPVLSSRARSQHRAVATLLDTLRRWGIRTLGQLAALPPGDVYERLGARGVAWQRLARGDDASPLVPWVPDEPFDAALSLEWPIEGLEPLSFVLQRLLEPLSDRLERADRGAAILHVHLRLVDKTVHARMLQLPAPMRDPKTLRTLLLLDLESNPPACGIDHVRVLIEPTPARITQWALFERAQPSPEQVSTLLARLAALMGDSHVGSPQLVDSWKPGAFAMAPFQPGPPHEAGAGRQRHGREDGTASGAAAPAPEATNAVPLVHAALRRFRLPVPARVQMHDGRPVRIVTDRRGIAGGPVVQAAGPWRTSGEWWNDGQPGRAWDRDEWDVALADGTVYRLYVERDVGQWFLEGVVD